MPIARLPNDPSFEQLRNQAKTLQRFVRAGVPQALEMVREFHPRLSDISADTPAATGFSRADAQLVTARRHGFPSWPRLRAYLEVVERYSRAPHRTAEGGTRGQARADEFLLLASLTHGGDDPDRWRRATELLAAHPGLTRASLHAAAAAGDVAAVRDWLDRDKTAASREGGPHRWEPLLYLAFSAVDDRATGRSHLETARLLLDAGADPAAGYLWEGLCPPYTALTGALTSGHSEPIALARLLLERGADANDSQALYELGGTDDTDVFELLFEFGLGTGDGGVWQARLAPFHPSPAQMVEEELIKAAACGWPRRARLILSHPVDPAGLGDRHPIHEGRTAWEQAMIYGHELGFDPNATFGPHRQAALHGAALRGNLAMVKYLIEHGADPGIEDCSFHATAAGWADHFGHQDVAAYLNGLGDLLAAGPDGERPQG